MVRIAYGGRLGTQGTDPVRRGDIGEDAGDRTSPATRKFPKSAKYVETVEIPNSRGVWGHKGPCEMPAIDPPPTAGSSPRSYEFLTLGPGAISHGGGEEKPKGTE